MSAYHDVDAEQELLKKLLGVGTLQVATPEALAAGLYWVLSMLRAKMDGSASCGRAEWMTPAQLEKHFGIGHSQMSAYVQAAKIDERVRKWVPETMEGVKGTTRFNVSDMEALYLVQRIDDEKAAQHERTRQKH